jgi:uncharacterized protein YegJ (DUF2314 family)
MADTVQYIEGDDPRMVAASRAARETFPQFWREIAYDFNRIVPAISLGAVKVVFHEDDADPTSAVEVMWCDDVAYDGETLAATLINQPRHLTSVREGDRIAVPLDRLSDWIVVLGEAVHGAYTVHVIRQGLPPEERAAHDAAWGYTFPDAPALFDEAQRAELDLTLAAMMAKHLRANPGDRDAVVDDAGRTMLHLMSLYGRLKSVQTLLDLGANRDAVDARGWTAADYARAVGYPEISALFD